MSSEQVAEFDHVIHWVDDLDAVMAAYAEAGLPTHAALTMAGFRNSAWGIDDERYVELATVDDWDAVTASKYSQGIEILRPAIAAVIGSGLVTFAVNVPDARAIAERLRDAGHDVEVVEVWFEERNGGFVEVFLRDMPTYFPFFITYQPPRAELARMRADLRAQNGVTLEGQPDLAALLVRSSDPEADARALGELLGCDTDGQEVKLPGAHVRFELGEPVGLYGLAVRGLGESASPSRDIAGVTVVSER